MASQPKLVIHGGAGSLEGNINREVNIRESLQIICNQTYSYLLSASANDAVLFAIKLLENDPLFNAGTGSKIQNDGEIRMSAGFMDGQKKCFSGVINIQNVQHPILVAELLQQYEHTVLSGTMATHFAHSNGFSNYDPKTQERYSEFLSNKTGKTGTVGVVALDSNGHISAGTSTGGIGCELPGRVSDSATIAGNYANRFAGVSATGVGEHIVNAGVAPKIITRVEDGNSLKDAVEKSILEGRKNDDHYGIICISNTGDIVVDKTKDMIFYASHNVSALTSF